MKKGQRRHRRRRGQRSVVLTAFCVALAAILLGMGIYVAQWYLNLGRIRAEGERYARLYGIRDAEATPVPASTAQVTRAPAPTTEPTRAPSPTPRPTATPAPMPTAVPTVAPTPTPTRAPAIGPDADMPVVVDQRLPTIAATATPTETATVTSTETATVTPSETPAAVVPVQTPSPSPEAAAPATVGQPIPTPDEDTLVFALPTAPPVQSSFDELLALNPDTVGFLDIEGMVSLPVVQRENDNEFYLDHSFEGAKALEGALFMDGMNRLVPEDDCLIVYGHNMKNKTMFGRLISYADISYLHQHSVIHFDTIYENRLYVAFAAFSASMEQGNPRYFDVRQFIFDEESYDIFVQRLKSRSVFRSPVDVRCGDRLLLLVTCNYASREGRFILALRQLRGDETESGMWAQALQSEAKAR